MQLRSIAILVFLMAGCVSAPGQYRPEYHFSPREHWTNDPNGLVYFEGEYHLFFQYNPFGDEWGHMSWGHAVSRDLLDWKQLPVAIPEENGVMIFTGSTVVDRDNTSGFCKGDQRCLVAVYTGHRAASGSHPARETQNLAYSTDRGRTWTKYGGNPVLDIGKADFRDPKVFWFAPSERWEMAVALPNEHKVRFYASGDLKHWSALSDFGPAGATGGQWECPELFALPVDGKENETRWVLKVGLNPGALEGGSGEQYFLGRFDGTRFTNENSAEVTLWTDYGKDCYCALTFNGLPQKDSAVMMGWMDNWQYARALPTKPWRGQMTIARKLSLRRTPEGVRLFQEPIEELRRWRGEHVEARNASVEEINRDFRNSSIVESHVFELSARMALGTAQEIGWRLLTESGSATVVGYDARRGVLFVDRTHSGVTGFSQDFATRTEAPLRVAGGVLRVDVLVDRCSIEVFVEDGRIAMTNLIFPPAGARGIEAYAKGGDAGAWSAELWGLRPATR